MDTPAVYDDYEEDDQSTLDLKVLFLYGAYRSKGRVLLFSLLGLAGGLLYAGSIPNMYQSVSQVKLLPDERGGMSPGQSMGLVGNSKPYMGPGIADHVNWLNEQEGVFQSVARNLGPSWVLADTDPAMYDTLRTPSLVRSWHRLQGKLLSMRNELRAAGKSEAESSPLEILAAAANLRDSTSLRATSEWVFTVTCLANSAEKAQEINYSVTQGLIAADQSFRKRANAVLISELTTNAREAQVAMDVHDAAWHEYRQSCGVFDYAGAWLDNGALIAQLTSDVGAKAAALEGLRTLVAHMKDRHAGMEDTLEVVMPPVTDFNPLWERIQSSILDAKTRLAELRTQPSTSINRNTITAVEQRVKGLEEELSEIPETKVSQPEMLTTVHNESKLRFETALMVKEGEFEQLQIELKENETRLQLATKRRAEISRCKPGHDQFAGKLEMLNQAHQQVADRLQKAQAFGLLDDSELSNMRIWHEASLNPDKVKPERSKPVLAGFGIGLALGLGLAVLRQLLDRRVRYPETVEKNLGLVMLGVVPDLRRLRHQPKRRKPV